MRDYLQERKKQAEESYKKLEARVEELNTEMKRLQGEYRLINTLLDRLDEEEKQEKIKVPKNKSGKK